MGRRHRPFFRLNAVESRTPRNGRIIEKLGHYDPLEKDKDKQIVLNRERIEYWLGIGAVPSDTVSQILLRNGIRNKYADEKQTKRARAKAVARAKGKPFTKAERVALAKEAEAKAAKEKAAAKEAAAKEAKAAKEAAAESAGQAEQKDDSKQSDDKK